MRLAQQLLTAAAAYADAIGRSEATVSRRLFGNGTALKRLREGKGMISDRIEDALQALSDLWPAETPWPAAVERPPQRLAKGAKLSITQSERDKSDGGEDSHAAAFEEPLAR